MYTNYGAVLSKFNFTLVFLKLISMLFLVPKENKPDQAHIFQDIFQKFLNTSASNNVTL